MYRLRASFLLGVSALVSCWAHSDGEVHVVPAGYTGSVVIVYADANSPEATRNDQGATVYRIPDSGTLRVSNAPRPAGFYDISYFYEAPDGTRIEIPSSRDAQGTKIFGAIDGVTGSAPNEVRWQAYVVGDPDTAREWGWKRDAHVSQALGQPPPIRPRTQ